MNAKLDFAAFVVLMGLPLLTNAQNCLPGSIPVQVTGHATTINVSPTKQTGQICLTVTTADGREVFDDCGALIGRISAMDTSTGSGTLSHTALFDMWNFFLTADDTIQITGILETDSDGAPCAMSVSEHMSRIKFGSGIFAHATIDVYGDGSISFCPNRNLNIFQLSGQGCIRKRHH